GAIGVITIDVVWVVAAVFLIGVAVLHVRERRWTAAAFWAIAAVPFVAGGRVLATQRARTHWPPRARGGGVSGPPGLVPRRPPHVEDDGDARAERDASAARLGNWLFAPALLIPLITVGIFLAVKLMPGAASVIDPAQSTLIALCVASLVAVAVALRVT